MTHFNYNFCQIFKYGSYVYDTITEKSDEDFIAIGDITEDLNIISNSQEGTFNYNIKVYSLSDFMKSLHNHEVSTIECISLLKNSNKDTFIIKSNENFEEFLVQYWSEIFDKKQLRNSFSQKSSNSFVKAKKKSIMLTEDSYIGLKSLFHSFRILDFGIQICENSYITNFNSMKPFWLELLSYKDEFLKIITEDDWNNFIKKYEIKNRYNELHTKFKKKAPK